MIFVVKKVDVWEMRCRFNKGRYWQRAKLSELISTTTGKPAHPKYNLGPGGQSQELYISDPLTGNVIARCHQLVKATGELGGGGKPDPKELFEDGFHYRIHKGSGLPAERKRDPSIHYPPVISWFYKRWRWIKCQIVGR